MTHLWRGVIEEYFRELVGVRLKVCGFQSKDIRDYLGLQAMKPDELVARLVSRCWKSFVARAASISAGVPLAQRSIESGAAARKLLELTAAGQGVAAAS